ncbi:IS3 family transposase [Limosilactobacillus ingluviei]
MGLLPQFRLETYKELIASIKESFNFYNHKRSQTQLGSRAPAEYRVLAA